MKLGPVVHGGLLVVALVFAYQTNTRKEDTLPKRGTHAVWKLGSLSTVVLESEKKRVRIEKREDENGSYYWGEVTRTTKTPVPAAAGPGAGDAGALDLAPEPETKVTSREFPVGRAGEELMLQYQNLMALRKVGPLASDDLERYNLHEKTVSLTAIEGGNSEHTLLLAGEKIYGGTDRYAYEVNGGIGYVLSGKLVQPLESAESSLSIRNVHSYPDAKVTSIAITTTAGDKVLVKNSVEDEGGEHIVWEYEEAPGTSEAALASFVDRVKKLKPTSYDPALEPTSLVHIATLRYRDSGKASLGYLELYRQLPEAQEPPKRPGALQQTQYFIKTERTRVLGKVGRLDADRVDQDLVELFGIAAPPAHAEPPASTPPASSPSEAVAPTPARPPALSPTAVPASAKPAAATRAGETPASKSTSAAGPASVPDTATE